MGSSTFISFSTLPSAGIAPLAASTARSASSGVATWPVSATPLSVARVFTDPCTLWPTAWPAMDASKLDGTTITWYWPISAPDVSSAATVVVPGATPKTNMLLALAGRTSAIFGSAVNTLVAGALRCSTWPLPADRVMVACTGAGRACASSEAVAGRVCAPARRPGTRTSAVPAASRAMNEARIRTGIPCQRCQNRRAGCARRPPPRAGGYYRWRSRHPGCR
jgi:hypothetical protein